VSQSGIEWTSLAIPMNVIMAAFTQRSHIKPMLPSIAKMMMIYNSRLTTPKTRQRLWWHQFSFHNSIMHRIRCVSLHFWGWCTELMRFVLFHMPTIHTMSMQTIAPVTVLAISATMLPLFTRCAPFHSLLYKGKVGVV
jgi:hypothetical protein